MDGSEDSPRDPRERVRRLVREHGRNATSSQVLEDGFLYWFGEAGCVAYVDTGRAWVAAGAPIGPAARIAGLAREFARDARSHRRRACFFATEGRFESAAGLRRVQIGEQPFWDPTRWEERLKAHRSLREQLRRARAKGVVVHLADAKEAQDPSSSVRRAGGALMQRWLATRGMPPMGFLVDMQPFAHPAERWIAIATVGGRTVGMLSAIPVYGIRGWFIEHLIRDPRAPNGTAETLVDFAMRRAASEGGSWVTLGLAPLSGSVPRWMRGVRRVALPLYDFEGLRSFKDKLGPTEWRPVYVAWDSRAPSWWVIVDVLAAFAKGSLVRFGVRGLLRGHSAALLAVAAMLAPWTALVGLADAAQWFPHRWAQPAWVGLNIGLIVGMVALSRRWRTWLATILFAVVLCDGVLAWLQILAFNMPRLSGATQWGAAAIAAAGPLLGAAVLSGALRRRAILEGWGSSWARV